MRYHNGYLIDVREPLAKETGAIVPFLWAVVCTIFTWSMWVIAAAPSLSAWMGFLPAFLVDGDG